jgi:hypothetical protein
MQRLPSQTSLPKWRMTSGKLTQAHRVTTKPVHHSKQGSKALQKVDKVVAQTQGQGDEEGASLDVQGVHSDFPRGFPHHLDNILTIGELAGGEEQAGRSHPHPGGLLEGTGRGGARNSMAAD